jgi:hypothetical protein
VAVRGRRDDSDHVARNPCSGCPDEFSAPRGSDGARLNLRPLRQELAYPREAMAAISQIAKDVAEVWAVLCALVAIATFIPRAIRQVVVTSKAAWRLAGVGVALVAAFYAVLRYRFAGSPVDATMQSVIALTVATLILSLCSTSAKPVWSTLLPGESPSTRTRPTT